MMCKLSLFVAFCCVIPALASEYCLENTDLEYCYLGCCFDDGDDDPCCSLPAGTIAGIVIGVIVLMVFIGLGIYALRRYRLRQATVVRYGPNVAQPTPVAAPAYTVQGY